MIWWALARVYRVSQRKIHLTISINKTLKCYIITPRKKSKNYGIKIATTVTAIWIIMTMMKRSKMEIIYLLPVIWNDININPISVNVLLYFCKSKILAETQKKYINTHFRSIVWFLWDPWNRFKLSLAQPVCVLRKSVKLIIKKSYLIRICSFESLWFCWIIFWAFLINILSAFKMLRLC